MGIYVAETASGHSAALAGAGADEFPAEVAGEHPLDKGFAAARLAATELRLVETAALGPPSRAGRAMLVRRHAVEAARRRLAAAVCGESWSARERGWMEAGLSVAALAAAAAAYLWVPRRWITVDMPALAVSASDLYSAVAAMCRDGVGDALSAEDTPAATHLALLFSRAALAPPEDDEKHLRWAAADVVRPRLVRTLALALGQARRA
jgi:hypothetical protein